MRFNTMFYFNFTWLTILSVILMVLWAGFRLFGKKKSVVLFLLAYLLLYVDFLALKKHFNFDVIGILLGITAIVGVVQFFRYKRKVQPSKELAIYIFLSVVHGLLYLWVSV